MCVEVTAHCTNGVGWLVEPRLVGKSLGAYFDLVWWYMDVDEGGGGVPVRQVDGDLLYLQMFGACHHWKRILPNVNQAVTRGVSFACGTHYFCSIQF